MRNEKVEYIRRLWLSFYGFYCRLLFPFYHRIKVGSLDLIVSTSDIMAPLSSSENLLYGDIHGKTILDIGTGCGIIALTTKKRGASYVLGVDINESAIASAETNLRNNFSDTQGIEFQQGDLYQSVTCKFDIIVSNPPYFKDLPNSPYAEN